MNELLIALSSLTLLGVAGLSYLVWQLQHAVDALHDTVDTLIVQEAAAAGLEAKLVEVAPGEYEQPSTQANVMLADLDADIGTFRGAIKWQ